MYIAGDGCLLKSTDNGTSWTTMFQNNNFYFFDVKFANNLIGYAVGWQKGANALNKEAALFKTTDGGNNWVLLYKASRKASASIKFTEGEMRNGAIDLLDESRLIWGCGTTPFYSVTGGRGNHWVGTAVQTYAASNPNLDKAFFGSSGLLGSLRGGVNFGTSGYSSSDYYDFDLVTPDDLYAVAGGSANEIYKIKVNQTNTSTYKSITGSTTADRFYGIDFLDLNYGFVVGKFGKVAYTQNGGDNWTQVTQFTSEQLNGIHFYNNNQAIVIGNNGTVLRLNSNITSNISISNVKSTYNETDINWSVINSETTNNLYKAEFKNGNMFVVGDGVILKSTDQGASFTTVKSDANLQFRDITFVSENIGWVIAYNIPDNKIDIYKTINGGSNWSYQTSMPGSSAGVITGLVIEALNSNFVLASYADAINSVKKITNDGGLTWSNVGGNFEVTPISDFIFFGTNYTSTGKQGYGPKRTGGGSYVAKNLETGSGGDNPGCISLTYSQWIKNHGMNAIATSENHLAIARDMDFLATSQTQTGWIERTKTPNPTTASDWSCHPTYTAVHYYGVNMYSSSDIWFCGEKGTIITTRNQNGGLISEASAPNPHKEWFGHETGVYSNLYDIKAVNADILIAVGDNGVILRTNNASSINNMQNTPSLVTTNISNILSTSAQSGGNIVFNGSSNVTQRGVCWSTSPNPTISNSTTINGTGTGVFTSNLTNLNPNTNYYVRAYATNSAGTSYGNEVSFNTISLPILTTTNISNITVNSASSGGFISNDGGVSITQRGVCWSTSPNPTISNSTTINGTGTGVFTSNLTNLNPNTNYYVRAYATNSAGTSYGNEVSFNTVHNTTSINNFEQNNVFQIYPNPTKSLVKVIVPEEHMGSSLQVLDALGRLIASRIIYSSTTEFDLSKFDSGIYIFQVVNLKNSNKMVERVVKN